MKRELNAAKSRDRTHAREVGPATSVRALGTGNEFTATVTQWVNVLRQRFSTAVIRRSIESKDNNGKPIFNLGDKYEHCLVMPQFQWERDLLAKVGKTIVSDDAVTGAEVHSKVCVSPCFLTS